MSEIAGKQELTDIQELVGIQELFGFMEVLGACIVYTQCTTVQVQYTILYVVYIEAFWNLGDLGCFLELCWKLKFCDILEL